MQINDRTINRNAVANGTITGNITGTITDDAIDESAWKIEVHGLAGLEDVAQQVARRADREGASPVLAAVLADPHAPEVARIRAFGLLALQLATAQAGCGTPLAA
jgi:hypothetical protein